LKKRRLSVVETPTETVEAYTGTVDWILTHKDVYAHQKAMEAYCKEG
jgi:hypothetical protein